MKQEFGAIFILLLSFVLMGVVAITSYDKVYRRRKLFTSKYPPRPPKPPSGCINAATMSNVNGYSYTCSGNTCQ